VHHTFSGAFVQLMGICNNDQLMQSLHRVELFRTTNSGKNLFFQKYVDIGLVNCQRLVTRHPVKTVAENFCVDSPETTKL